MSICCYDLVSLKYFKNIKLVAGRSGLYRQVTWPYICTTSSISQWVHGGELIFVTGAGFDPSDTNIKSLMEECISQSIAGIVIVTGNQSLKQISKSLLDYANKISLPLFEMSWNTKLVDVTQEVSELILQRKEQFRQSQLFLERLLFSNTDNTSFSELYDLYNIPNKPYRFISVIYLETTERSYDSIGYVKNDLISYLHNHCNNSDTSLISLDSTNNIICFATADNLSSIDVLKEAIKSVFLKISDRYKDIIKLYLGFGRVYYECEDSKIRTSFHEAQRAITLLKKGVIGGSMLYYDDAGIYKLFYEVKNNNEIKLLIDHNIGCLIENDLKSSGNLLATLRCYLENNCNLVSTAQSLFIHRNTLVYRLNTIKELLQKDLNDSGVRYVLFTSILAHDFIQKVN